MTAGCVMSTGRREFLRRVAVVSASVPACLLTAGGWAAAQVTIPSEFDTSLESIAVAFRGASGMTLGYVSLPKTGAPRPGLVVVHDVAGLTPGIRGVARNAATSGYTVVAPDLLSPQGGTAGFRGVAADVQRAVNATTAGAVAAQLTAALSYAKSHGGSGGHGSGLIGFGWGATQSLLFAAGRTEIAACVAFYPDPQQTLKVLSKITAPVLALFAGDDPATKEGAALFDQAAASSRRSHVVRVFPGLMRGFHDPAETKVYKPDAAKEAWTLAMQHLGTFTKEKTKGEALPEGGK